MAVDYRSDSSSLREQTLVLIVTGGIAAYKSVELVRLLQQRGARVRVIMTSHAEHFVGPMTFQAITGLPVVRDMFSLNSVSAIEHIALADEATGVIIAPATANIIGKLAHGIADDFASTFLLATPAPVLIAPAMNPRMYAHPAVQSNLQILRQRGVCLVGPATGDSACGHVGSGRMESPQSICDQAAALFSRQKDLTGKSILITAGPTREAIDPVRFISNRSSGLMGYALAAAAAERGANVTLISGPVSHIPHALVNTIRVDTAETMRLSVLERFDTCDVLIMAAAVADWRPERVASKKMKKNSHDHLMINCVKTSDILAEIATIRRNQIVVGFAAETGDPRPEANRKLTRKHLDFIVANDVSRPDAGFDVMTNAGYLISKSGECFELSVSSKRQFADSIFNYLAKLTDNLT